KGVRARLGENEGGTPGEVIAIDREQTLVACGKGSLALEVLQKPGGKPLPVAQFVQGFPIKVGDRFTTG
ncbi:MAG: methionyl-tRNA formyltransferase, partial [Sideroxydans sp.]